MIKKYLTHFLREMDKIKDDDIRRFFTIMYLNFCWGKIENDYSLLYQENLKNVFIYILLKIEATILAYQNLTEEQVYSLSKKILNKKEYLNSISYQPE